MDTLAGIISRPQARSFRTRDLDLAQQISLDKEGLLQWSPKDKQNPKEWTRAKRWYITAICIVLILNASMASSAPSACLQSITEEFEVSKTVAKLTVGLFVLGFCAGPCLWGPLSEYYGRRLIFIGTFICYFAFTFLCAFAPNIESLLIARFLCAFFVGGTLSNTPGVFADLWGPIERGNCMLMYIAALQMGTAVGPITAGFYQLKLNWRWIFYQLLWVAGFSVVLLPAIPETLPSRALLSKAKRIRKAAIPGFENIKAPIEVDKLSLLNIFRTALIRPWAILSDPIALLLAIYLTVVYTLLYMLFTMFPIAFIQVRGWNAGVGELPLVSVVVGNSIGALYIYWDSLRQRKKIAAGHQHCVEDTLPIAMVGAVCFPIGLFSFGWTAQYASIHWIAPTISGVMFSISILTLFVGFSSYLSESYLQYAASAQAGNQIVRSLVAATAPLWTQQMFDTLTVGGGGSLIGGIALLLMPIPFIFYKHGAKIRAKSKFAPAPQDRKDDVQEEETRSTRSVKSAAAGTGAERKVDEAEERPSETDSVKEDTRFGDSDDLEKREVS